MGANTHLEGVFSYGYTVCETGSVASACQIGIPPLEGYRIAIQNAGFTSTTGTTGYLAVMKVQGRGVVEAETASGATTINLTGSTLFADLAFASLTLGCIQLKDGKYLFSTIDNYWASTDAPLFGTALTASVAAGATMWQFGVAATAGHQRYMVPTAAVAQNIQSYGSPGFFYTTAKGDPTILHIAPGGTAVCSIQYVNGGYINA
jgi:hypothetical protein